MASWIWKALGYGEGDGEGSKDPEELAHEYEDLCAGYDAKTGAKQITAEEVKKRGLDSFYIVDVRTEEEFDASSLSSARNLEPSMFLGQFRGFKKGDLGQDEVPEGKTVLCYCTAGLRSGHAAAYLESQLSRPVLNLHGGIIAWVNAGGELVSPKTGDASNVIHCYGTTWSKYMTNPGFESLVC